MSNEVQQFIQKQENAEVKERWYSYPFVLELMYQQVEALNSVANSHNACFILIKGSHQI